MLLLGGASGVGKSQISRQVAHHFDADVTAVDDIYLALERMTTPEQYPEVHRWRLHPDEVLALDDDAMLDHNARVRRGRGAGLRRHEAPDSRTTWSVMR